MKKLVLLLAVLLGFLSSCNWFGLHEEEPFHGNKLVFENKTTKNLNCFFEWGKSDPQFRNSDSYNIPVNGTHVYEEKTPIEDLLKDKIDDFFRVEISNGVKNIKYTDLQLDTLPENIHSIININSWVKDSYVADGDTFDILKFTFTDKDFE